MRDQKLMPGSDRVRTTITANNSNGLAMGYKCLSCRARLRLRLCCRQMQSHYGKMMIAGEGSGFNGVRIEGWA